MKMNLIRLKKDPQSMIHMRVDRVCRLTSLNERLLRKDPSMPSEILKNNKELSRISKKLTWYKVSLYRQVWMNVALLSMPEGANIYSEFIHKLVRKSVTRKMAEKYIEKGISLDADGLVKVPESLICLTVDGIMKEVPDIPTQD